MSHLNHFFKQLNDAIAKDFTHHFQILPSGVIRCIATKREYKLEHVVITAESCVDCKSTFYLIVTEDGLKGSAYESWDL